MRHDIEVVFDLPDDAFGPTHTVSGAVDAEVRALRQQVVTLLYSTDHGRAEQALQLLAPHRHAPEGAVVSALLVCTHHRFERCSRTLMRRLEDEGLLADDQLDELAVPLLFDDRACFAVPASWVGTPRYVSDEVPVRADGVEVAPADDTQPTFPHLQDIPAAARRWAARRLLQSGLTDVAEVLARADQLDAGWTRGAAGAVRCGVLDAWEACPPAQRQAALDVALGSSQASVRLRALDVLVDTGRREEALALARRDGAAQVRAWQPADTRPSGVFQPSLLD